MSDRIKFVLNMSVQYFAASSKVPSHSVEAETAVRDFVENTDNTVLAAICTAADSRTIRFVAAVPADCDCLLFYKIPQIGPGGGGDAAAEVASDATVDGTQLGMLTLIGGLVQSMYSSVTRVYAPHVTQRSEYTPELEDILESLHTSLGSSLGFPKSGLHSIRDEIHFWSQLAEKPPTKADRDKAHAFIGALVALNKHVRQLQQPAGGSLASLATFLDAVHALLDDLWRLPERYPQSRMQDLLDVTGSAVVASCAVSLRHDDPFSVDALHTVAEQLGEATELLNMWLRVCDSLTRLFWPNNGQHQWLGEPHRTALALQFVERLQDVGNMRAMFQQIVVVFDGEAAALRRVQGIFQQFNDVNLFDITPFGCKRWSALQQRLEQQLQPIDEQCAQTVRTRLRPHLDNARQIVHLFATNAAILRRPSVMKLLAAEREQFACALHLLLDEMRTALATGAFQPDGALHLSPVCNECQWLKIYEQQLHEIEQTAGLLEGHAEHLPVIGSVQTLRAEIGKLLAASYDRWRDESLAAVQSGELSLKTDEPVVEFEPDGRHLMRVTFNPRLVTFCQDVRQLESLGQRIPLELRDTCTLATRFMASARRLLQISNFHNTIGDRMIACQRPIMLSNAVELSRLVQSESVTWNDQESVDRYVHMLQVSVGQLDRDNAYLSGQHEAMKAIIVRLMGVDLIRQAQVWKDEMRRLREIVFVLESKGYTNLNAFKLHWDYQLYKVLEHHYVAGLTDLSNKLPDIHVDLLFRQQELQFRPPLAEIRFTYFEHLRKFLERPLAFRGLSDQSGRIFGQMIARNRRHFDALYARSEDAFGELHRMRALWRPWVALGQANVDDLCAVHLRSWSDWDRNFKSCKHFGQQIAKIQTTEMRSGCFVVNVTPLRADIEHIGRRYWEILAGTLRTSILEDIDALHQFVQQSLAVLQNVPLDEVGIAEAGAKYERIMAELPAMRERLAAVERKDTCLAGWCKERVSTLAHLVTQWDQLQPLIENHSLVLQRQVDMMRDHIEAQLGGWREEAEKFEIRWEATVEELRSGDECRPQLLRERQQSWREISERHERLAGDCAKFNIAFGGELSELFARIDGRVRADGAEWEQLDAFNAELELIGAEEWTVYRRRPYILTQLLSKWSKAVAIAETSAAHRIRQQLETVQQTLPILQTMQADGLTERHWSRIFSLLGVEGRAMHDVQLHDVLGNAAVLLANSADIQTLVREAAGEQVIRQALAELEQWGAVATLGLVQEHRDARGDAVPLGKDYQEVLNRIGDNQSLLQSAKNSSSFEAFSDQATIWETRLATLDAVLTSLNQIQRKWIYLEPIFNNGTMTSDGNAFQRIDKDFRYIMKHIAGDTRLLSIVKINNIATVIESLESQLARCQSALQSFITLKRNAFPRFYFLADDDLLEILGQSTKIDVLQKHINKLFPGIQTLGIAPTGDRITDIRSADGDIVSLVHPIDIATGVETWLNLLVTEIRTVLTGLIDRCARADQFQLADIAEYPVQVLSTAKALVFTRQTEKAIQSMTLPTHLQRLQAEMDLYNSDQFRGDRHCPELSQTKIRALLIDMVHYVDVVGQLVEHNCTRLTDWPWLQQLKFHTDAHTGQISVRQVYAEFAYAYEFLGSANRLVHTRLTHRCYLTLTQAQHMGLGGNPFGPAGTGKTECVKSLGAMLGRLVLVFNCSENVDTAAMALILSGLARCGAWGCFDEFNRLPSGTLADISALVQPLQLAIKAQAATVRLGDGADDAIPLNLHCGIFVTMNPAGAEYGGRQQLPGALQSLFRPIVMQQPEPADIAGVLLFTERFRHARRLGAQLAEVFAMCGQMLSAQRHYDWGLRELRTVLTACGRLRKELATAGDGDDDVFATEARLVVHALRSNTMSKLSSVDCGNFDMLLQSIFANVSARDDGAPPDGEGSLRSHVLEAFGELGLHTNAGQVEKCLQLYEQLTKRMGVVVFGPPLSGKSTLVSVLRRALAKRATLPIRTHTMSPKSMTRAQLLGSLDADTRQWMDGVLTSTAMTVNAEPLNITSWIICDGDIDPEWIEALNSVLDDNRLLTLPSGWRIQFRPNVNFIFETHDLQHASPATISRMGIVALSAADLPATVPLAAWLQSRHPQPGDQLDAFAEAYLMPAIEWLAAQNCTVFAAHPHVGMLQNCLPFLEEIESDAGGGGGATKEEFCVALLRGLGSLVQPPDRLRAFCAHLFELCDIYVPQQQQQSEPELCYFDERRRAIALYDSVADSNDGDGGGGDAVELVRTAHVRVYEETLRCLLRSERRPAMLLCGPAGIGKSLLLRHMVAEFSGYQLCTINCSAQLSGAAVLHAIRQHCLAVSAVRGREYRAKQQRLVLYVKNVNRCAVDAWGTCAVTELLLQIIQRGGFYALDTLEWITLSGCQVCASVSAEAGALGGVSVRFLGAVRLLAMGAPNELEMQSIFRQQIGRAVQRFDGGRERTDDAVDGLLNVYYQLAASFTRSGQQTHYVFNPKMLSTFIAGLRNYPADSLANAFRHELVCIFRNRLTSDVERNTFDGILAVSATKILATVGQSDEPYFLPQSGGSELLATDADEWRELVEKSITICGAETLAIRLPVTALLMQNVAHVARVLGRREPPSTTGGGGGGSGHLVLCGPSGSCRTAALHVACTHLGVRVCTVVPVRGYSLEHFYGDLKVAMQTAALDEQPVAFHVQHAWLEYLPAAMRPVEAVLQGGELDELFGDDVEGVASGLRAAAQAEGFSDSLAAYFWLRVHRHFHLVLSLDSAVGDTRLAELFKLYPCLYQNAEMIFMRSPLTVDTCQTYTQDLVALTASANNLTAYEIPATPASLIVQLPGDWGASPLRHAQLAQCYAHLFHSAAARLHGQRRTLQAGVTRLSAANAVVDQLQQQAHVQEVELAEKKRLAQQSLELIATTMRSANVQRTSLLELRQQTQASGERLLERKAAIEAELRDVEPVLREATAAVGQIRGEALSEIRSLRAPPDVIRDILEGVLRLMGVRDTSWNSMKSFLAKRGVKEDIRALDPARITPENCAAVERLLATKADSFLERNAKRASAAAAPLATWVMANVKYARVMQSIKPLEQEQAQLQLNLDKSEGEMRSLTTGLDDVDGRVQELSGQLNLYTQEAAVLEIGLNEARATLSSSEVLVAKLSAEYGSWQTQLAQLELELTDLAANTFVTALAVTHLSHLAIEQRTELLDQVQQLLELPDFNLTKSIVSDQDQIIWESIGLTSDVQAIDNAAILTKILQLPFGTAPVPLLLDPAGHALNWLREYLRLQSTSTDLCTADHPRFPHILELAVRFGKCLIVPDFDAVRPPLLALLVGDSAHRVRFNKPQLPVGNKLVDQHADFRLVLVTRSAVQPARLLLNAHITAMPFTTTVAGYTEQLMTRCVQLHRPQLELERRQALADEGRQLSERARLQAVLLHALSSADGDLLRNDALLATLNEVKQSSLAIDAALQQSHRVRVELMRQYGEYREYCQEAARFYLGVRAAYGLDVTRFTELFEQSIADADVDERTDVARLARLTYTLLARTTAKADHVQLGLQVCRAAFPYQVMDTEWESFITDLMSEDDASGASGAAPDDDLPAWMQPSQAAKIRALRRNHPTLFAQLDGFTNQTAWQAFAVSRQSGEVPATVAASEFQKLLVTQCLRPELVLTAAARCVCRLLGLKSLAIAAATVQQLADEPTAGRPAVLLLLTSSDDSAPAHDVQELAVSRVGAGRFVDVAVTRGHEQRVLTAVRSARAARQWCCLMHVHQLPDDTLAALAAELDERADETVAHDDSDAFRLWLIGDHAHRYPAVLLHRCSVLLYEPPAGLKLQLMQQLQRAQPTMARRRWDARNVKLRVLLHILHAALLERRRYVPQGWAQCYEFSAADGRTAQLAADWLTGGGADADRGAAQSQRSIDWAVLHGLCELIAYGGRIAGRHDGRVLRAHLRDFLCDRALGEDAWRPLRMQRLAVPLSANVSDHMAAVAAGLADDGGGVERPEWLGLAPSTNGRRDVIGARQLLKRLRGIHLAKVDYAVASYEKRLRPILSLWKKLNSNPDSAPTAPTETPTNQSSAGSPSTPWQSFVRTEHQLAGALLQHINATLRSLHALARDLRTGSAAAGLGELDLRRLQLLAENQVPTDWRVHWPAGPRQCNDFLRAVRWRATAAQQRHQSDRFAVEMRLGDVFNLAAYLAALKLTNAAELHASTGDLVLRSTLSSTGNRAANGPQTRPTVTGLMIDGALFRGNRVVLATGGGGLDVGAHVMPDFQLFYGVADKPQMVRTNGDTVVTLPVYASESRELLVCELSVDTAAESDAVVLAGVALVVAAVAEV